ncbi:MAG: GNAT family N-acetyltransferase [Candidatus Dormibacteraeota bacterium]|nr:GNAT family N-acetyltransferase [Candidatus Dormibacteraeota bacterium]
MYGPVLTGSNFRLRPFREEDAQLVCDWFADLEVTLYLSRRTVPSLQLEREWLQKMATSETDIVWCIESEDLPVGSTAAHSIDWLNGHATTGTVIGDRTVWGKGIGGELMCLRRDYLFREFRLNKLKSAYLEGNEASARAQRAAGYREVGRFQREVFRDGRWFDQIQTELLREDWEGLQE